MKHKRMAILLCLLLSASTAASAASAASATLASLDAALAPLLDGRGAVSMSARMNLETLMPFDETRLDLLNRVLRHARLDARVDLNGADSDTGFLLALGDQTLLEMTEQRRDGAYLLQTSLLPNRMLFSKQASPMDTLLASSQAEETKPETSAQRNTSSVEEAFDMLAAVQELESCSRALTDGIIPLTGKKSANYNIKDIGKGRVSYVARLTIEQSGALSSEIRAVLSCGMDAQYREELSRVTFASGFIVALYQNADEEDICVYIKGTIVYPDGDKRTLKWQWAFTPGRETQTFLHEAARESGTRDSRVINALLTRTETDTGYTLEEKTVVNLRRGSLIDTSALTINLAGEKGEPLTCKGSVTHVTEQSSGGESVGETQTGVTVDLALTQTNDGAELTGTAAYLETKNSTVQTELTLTFAPAETAAADEPAGSASSAPSVVISITPADPAVIRLTAETPTATAEELQAAQPEFLVSMLPVGLYDYPVPSEMITINMDDAQDKVVQSLMNEAAQRLAGHLVLAILDLPTEDRALLSDGMTGEDYAVFLAMLD